MRKGVFFISLLICLVIASSIIMFQSSSPTAFGAVQGLQTGSKIVYGPYYNLSSSNPIQIPVPSGWSVTSINMSFSNIRAPNSTIKMEEEAFKANNITNIARAMSFQLPENQTAYLYSASFYLLHFPFERPLSPIYLNISLYNATSTVIDDVTVPKPHFLLNSSIFNFPLATGPIGWKDFYTDDSLELDPDINTYNSTFFMSINASTLASGYQVFWFFSPDNGTGSDGNPTYEDKGYAFYYNGSDWSFEYANNSEPTYGGIDYCLRVRVSASNETSYWLIPFPENVNMKVNDTMVQNLTRGEGLCNLSQPLNISENMANLYIDTSWLSPLIFDVTIEIYGVDVLGMLYMNSLTTFFSAFFSYNFMKDNQNKFFMLLSLMIVGAVAASGYFGSTTYKRRRIPLNAMRSLENILVDHNTAGTLIWAFDFISMGQDVALISGFMSAIKSFLEEMKVGGLKRLSTEA
mgnify:FL=1